MGSYAFDGQISVTPPLNFAQYKQVREEVRKMIVERHGGKPPRYLNMDSESFEPEAHMPLKAVVETSTYDTDEGTVTRKTVSSFVPTDDSEGSLSFSMANQMNRLIKMFPEHAFSGMVTAVETEQYYGGIRIVVQPGQPVEDIVGTTYIHFGDGGQVRMGDLV